MRGCRDEKSRKLLPLLDDGDILIDGGNSHFPDTIRRTKYVESCGKLYIGTGVSGGEEGALKGPSMMPGGSPAAWPYVKPIFQSICAKVEDGSPCCGWVGENGAGHFVKMVHNGIEYGDMQLICKAYQLMRDLLGMLDDEMHEVFAAWNKTELDSYLIEITRDILAYKDTDSSPSWICAISRSGSRILPMNMKPRKRGWQSRAASGRDSTHSPSSRTPSRPSVPRGRLSRATRIPSARRSSSARTTPSAARTACCRAVCSGRA